LSEVFNEMTYALSSKEQTVMRRTLLGSVKVIKFDKHSIEAIKELNKVRKHDQQGTSHEENIDMLDDEIDKALAGEDSRIFHKAWNIIVEWVRAHAWGASWIIVGLIAGYVFAIVDWIFTGTFL